MLNPSILSPFLMVILPNLKANRFKRPINTFYGVTYQP